MQKGGPIDTIIDAIRKDMDGDQPGAKTKNLFHFMERSSWLQEYTAKIPNTLEETGVFLYFPHDGRPPFEVKVPEGVGPGSFITFPAPDLPDHQKVILGAADTTVDGLAGFDTYDEDKSGTIDREEYQKIEADMERRPKTDEEKAPTEDEEDEEDEELPDIEENALLAELANFSDKEGYQEILDLFEFQPKGVKITTGGGKNIQEGGGFFGKLGGAMGSALSGAASAVGSVAKGVGKVAVGAVKIATLPITAPAKALATGMSKVKKAVTGEDKWRKEFFTDKYWKETLNSGHMEKDNKMLVYICKDDPCKHGEKGVVKEGGKQKILSPALIKKINLKEKGKVLLTIQFWNKEKSIGSDDDLEEEKIIDLNEKSGTFSQTSIKQVILSILGQMGKVIGPKIKTWSKKFPKAEKKKLLAVVVNYTKDFGKLIKSQEKAAKETAGKKGAKLDAEKGEAAAAEDAATEDAATEEKQEGGSKKTRSKRKSKKRRTRRR